jgi:hypothetical protein
MVTERKAQSAVWGLLSILVLVVIAGGLVDIYRLYAARKWAYSVRKRPLLQEHPEEGTGMLFLTTGFIQWIKPWPIVKPKT